MKAEDALSTVETPYAVICPTHGQVFLNQAGYFRQMDFPGAKWICPRCGAVSEWDDDNYEKHMEDDE
jgi:uncharacterized C2H2 Zn-finger protein